MQDIKPILEENYNITSITNHYIGLNRKRENVASVFGFIESILQMSRGFSYVRESLLIKNNIKEIASIFLSDLIADSLNISPVTNNSADSALVRRAEELIEGKCENLFTIQEIAGKIYTSPRNLQKAFKKHRNYTPMQFLKTRKLHKAYKLFLLKGGANVSVKEIALRVGIFDLNRFSKYYSELFGELPGETLKSSHT